MLKYPEVSPTQKHPSGVFIGDEHDKLYHLAQLTASIGELVTHGVQVLFIEAFYAANPPAAQDTASLATYLKNRNFNHTTNPTADAELPKCYVSLLQRCKRANLPVLGVDVPMPDAIKNGKVFGKIRWRANTVNDDWQANIEKACADNQWAKFAVFGGRAHAKALTNRFRGRLTTNIWDPTHKQYQSVL